MFNFIRYRLWINKLNKYYKEEKVLGYRDRDKLFNQVRKGKLTKTQADTIMDMDKESIVNRMNRHKVQNIVNDIFGEDYTVQNWSWNDDKTRLYIQVVESNKFIEINVSHEQEKVEAVEWYAGESTYCNISDYTYEYIMEIKC